MFEEKDILNFLSGSSDPDLLGKIELLRADEDFDQDLNAMSKVWGLADELKTYQKFDVDAAWSAFAGATIETAEKTKVSDPVLSVKSKTIQTKTEQLSADTEELPEAKIIEAPRSSRIWGRIAIAASVAMLITAGYFFLQKDYVFVGGKTWAASTILPDGSEVTLNDRNSTLKYPKTFEDKTERRIEIAGNAEVDVIKDINKQFFVDNYGARVTVTGTVFKITSDSSTTELENVSGKMSIEEIVNPANSAELKTPGDKAVFVPGKPIAVFPAYVEPAPQPPDTPGVRMLIMDIIDSLTTKYESQITVSAYMKEDPGIVKVLLNQPLDSILLQLDSTANFQYTPATATDPKIIYHFTPK